MTNDIFTTITNTVTTTNDIVTTVTNSVISTNDIVTTVTNSVTATNDVTSTVTNTVAATNDIVTTVTNTVTTTNDIVTTVANTVTTPPGITNETTVPLASMDSVVGQAFKNEPPTIITKTLISTAVKAAAAYGVNKGMEKQDPWAQLSMKVAWLTFSIREHRRHQALEHPA